MPTRLDAITTSSVTAELAGLTQLRDRPLTLDFAQCSYVSSAGVRLILMAAKNLQSHGLNVSAINVGDEVFSVLELTGLNRMITIQRKPLQIDMDGLKFLSAGVCGECFRLDEDRIVKLYREGIAPDVAFQEKNFARAAFILGIPTAVSYQVVTCGNRSGVIFELLDAELFSTLIRNNPDNLDHYARILAGVMGTVNTVEGDPVLLPDMKDRIRDYIRQIAGELTEADVRLLLDRLDEIPDASTCVHFDLHTSNIMIQSGEPVIIDMGDLSLGSYLFDAGWIFAVFGMPELGLCELATRIPVSQGQTLWNMFEAEYFSSAGRDLALFNRHRYFLASMRIIYTIVFFPDFRDSFMALLKNVLLPRIRRSNPS